MIRPRGLPRLVLAAALGAAGGLLHAAELEQVGLDTASGVVRERLPFDVPFLVSGQAPPNTTRVEAVYQLRPGRDEAFGPEEPASPIVSGVDAEASFRIQMPALPPNRHVRFRLVFERRLSTGVTVRADIEELLRRELRVGAPEVTPDRAALLRAALLAQYDLALARPFATLASTSPAAFGRGEIERRSASAVFDDRASEEAVRGELALLARDVLAAQIEREAAVERHRDVARSFAADLEAATLSPDLLALLGALEQRPETDPRDVGTRLALAPTARRLVGMEAGARAAVAEGRSASEAQVGLESASRSEDALAFAERHRLTASGLQELREWLQGLVLATGENRATLDELVRRGDLTAAGVEALHGLASLDQGALRRAERRAEALAAHAQSVARTLRTEDQALLAMAGALEARALSAVVRQSLLTEPASTESAIYVGLDVGVLYPPELDRASLYIGANLYFRPINKRAPLRTHGSLGHRLSLTIGISLNNLKLEEGDPRFENLLGEDSNLLVGAGLRLSRSLRVSAGALLFLKNDENPLVTDRSLAATFYTAVSFDVDVVRAFRSLGQ